MFCSQQARTGLVRREVSWGEVLRCGVLIEGERTEDRGGLWLYHGDAEEHRAADRENVGETELDGFLRTTFLAVYGVPVTDPVCLVLSDVGLLLR
jgi:hypothetical protein